MSLLLRPFYQTCTYRPLLAVSGSARFRTATTKAEQIQNSESGLTHFQRLRKGGGEQVQPSGQTLAPHSEHSLPHPIWDSTALNSVEQTHLQPGCLMDKSAYYLIQAVRGTFDMLTGYKRRKLDMSMWITRLVFLETVAGVPGMVGAMIRHLHSLRKMERDCGWIHTLLEEAENERLHLMIALCLKQPGILMRSFVLITQGLFFWSYGFTYLIAPRFAHRLVGYLEEEAVKTYTELLKHIDEAKIFVDAKAPYLARDYYQLPADAQLRDVFECMRADESHHRDVNHTFASLKEQCQNPFPPGH